MSSTAEFRLSITRALGDQVQDALARLTPEALDREHIAAVEPRAGVYQLYHRDEFVYVGQTANSLPRRLGEHLRKIEGRMNITSRDMGFTAMYVEEDLSAVAPETLLISRYKAIGGIPWNADGGFGPHDPGRERDTSRVAPTHFDALYPVNLEFPCVGITAGSYVAVDLLKDVKKALPFLFRYSEGSRKRASQPAVYHETFIDMPCDDLPADDMFAAIAKAMPADWQVTVLPGYVIMYRERKSYPSARKVYPPGA